MADVSLPHDAKAGPTKSEVRAVLAGKLALGPTDHFVEVGAFEKETLAEFEGPTPRSKELIGWPGIAEASAIAGGREHDLLAEKTRNDEAVTVAIGR